MSNPQPMTKHLEDTQWTPGVSGNPAGKPKGTKHLSTHIREMLEDEQFEQKLQDGSVLKGAPVKALIRTLLIKAVNGDLRAFGLLARYGYGTKIEFDPKNLPTPILPDLSPLVVVIRGEEEDKPS
jgi:hypothetical protein